MKLQDKVAIVTGGGRGLGCSIALLFGKEGGNVVVTAQNQDQIKHVAQELKVLRKKAIAVRADVSNEAQVSVLVQKTWRTTAPSTFWSTTPAPGSRSPRPTTSPWRNGRKRCGSI